jgi:outer membrane protein TolC
METAMRGTANAGHTAARIAGYALLVLAFTSAASAADLRAGETEPADQAARIARVGEEAAVGDLVAIALHANPMIRAARSAWRVTVENYRVDTAWPDPELMAEGMYEAATLGDTAKPMDWQLGVTQEVPLWGRQGTAEKLSSVEATIARVKLDAAIRDVALQVRQSAAELRYLREVATIVRAQQLLVDKLTSGGAAAYAADRASLYEVMKARAQSGQLDFDGLLTDESASTELARLNALLDRPPDAPLGPITAEAARPVLYTVEEIGALAEAHGEDVRVARAELLRSEAMADLTRYETLPGVKLGVIYGARNDVN